MPATNTITAFYVFAPGTVIRSAYVNNNFDNMRGHIIPIDPTAAAAGADMTWDLGGVGHSFRGAYYQYGILYQNTAGSIPANPTAGSMAMYFKSDGKAYTKSPAGIESALGGGALVNTGTRAAPSTITVSGIVYSTTGGARQHWYIVGDTITGTDVTGNPQISPGSDDGQELFLTGRDSDRPVILDDGTGLRINGTWVGTADSTIHLRWDTTNWVEMGRNDI